VNFDDSGSSDPDGTIDQYDWAFGDGFIALDAGPTPSHTYQAGWYLARLMVTDDSGEIDTDVAVVRVGIGNLLPRADAGPASSSSKGTRIFDGTGSSDPDGIIVSYDWEFGDGNTGTGQTPTHVYDSPGTYFVILTVTDNDGTLSSDFTVADVEKKKWWRRE
jgi:chitinase